MTTLRYRRSIKAYEVVADALIEAEARRALAECQSTRQEVHDAAAEILRLWAADNSLANPRTEPPHGGGQDAQDAVAEFLRLLVATGTACLPMYRPETPE